MKELFKILSAIVAVIGICSSILTLLNLFGLLHRRTYLTVEEN